jgi:chromosome segregation protein
MQIRRLELQGFKSFKDKTVIHFDDGITGIVGPNGCGKSNVVDAFFWVMGEQNARSLRGQSMDDLIFSGADKAPPASSAEVTLILEMAADISGPQAPSGASAGDSSAPTKEVSITRKLYRSGESDYFLNKVPCRLRDIQELFMDTGVGARGYSIIQQGQIAKIVQAKPEDRRTMIEEVAGIVKYKARRKESMRKLEGTQQNLLRVTDVINELEVQKRQMERQAEKARKFKDWREALQGIELRFNALKWEDLVSRVGALEGELESLSLKDQSLLTARETAETVLSEKRLSLVQAQKIAEEFQQKWMEAGKILTKAESDLKFHEMNRENLKGIFSQLEQTTAEEQVLINDLQQQLSGLESEAASMEETLKAAELFLSEKEEFSQKLQRDLKSVEEGSEVSRKRLMQVMSQWERARSEMAFAARRMAEITEDLSKLGASLAERTSFAEENKNKLAELEAQKASVQSNVDEARQRTSALNESIRNNQTSLQEKRKTAARNQSERAALLSTVKSLEDQKQRHESSGKGVKSVFQKILSNRPEWKEKVIGTVSDFLKAEKGHEIALEAALGKGLDVIATTDGQLNSELGSLLLSSQGGRASFVNVSALDQEGPSVTTSSVSGDGYIWPLVQSLSFTGNHSQELARLARILLAQWHLVETSTQAQTLATQHPNEIFVALTGEITRGQWYLEAGDKSGISGAVVGRNRELSEASDRLAAVEQEIQGMSAEISALETAISEQQLELNQTEKLYRDQQQQLHGLTSSEARLRAQLEECERSLARFESQKQTLLTEHLSQQEKEKNSKVEAFSLETEKGALEVKIEGLSSELLTAKAAWDQGQEQVLEARVKRANLLDQHRSLEGRTKHVRTSLEQHLQRIEQLLEQAKRRKEESTTTEQLILTLSSQMEQLKENLVQSEAAYREAKGSVDQIDHAVEQERSKLQNQGSQEREVQDGLMRVRLDLQKLIGERDLLNQNTLERYGLVLAEYALAPETQEQVQLLRQQGEEHINSLQAEVLHLREKIRKLGDVNPSAVEEYDAIVDRFNLLSSQKADLERAMTDLQSTVERINHVSKERFERAFHEVNNHFKRVFPVIFGGGHAHLTLTNPEDMLETGVDITAQPPGKKAQNINLLSGGEKTLTAISLLFSLFLVKPSPFCLLDEVDAPLDDANIGRFNALLREMSKRSQFVIITHNKRTMELNDKLYGVTMEDAGVSKMVSIQLSASA